MTTKNQLRSQAVELVKQYHGASKAEEVRFAACKNPVQFVGPAFSAKNLLKLVDSSPVFLLFAGRYTQKVEALVVKYCGT